jgi:hypothetical protein
MPPDSASSPPSTPDSQAGSAEPLPRAEPPRGPWWKCAVAVAIAITAGIFLARHIVNYSTHHGRLATLPDFDDCTYLLDGYQRYDYVRTNGLLSAPGDYISNPPHSPYATYLATFSYWLFGFDSASP